MGMLDTYNYEEVIAPLFMIYSLHLFLQIIVDICRLY